jgi:hypothetical protein
MKLLNDEQILAIKHTLETGFKENGYTLSEREKWIIDLTVKTAVGTTEQLLNYDGWYKGQ